MTDTNKVGEMSDDDRATLQEAADAFASGHGIDWSDVETVFNILERAGIIKPYTEKS